MAQDLTQQAQAILRTNDRGGFTVPTAQLYPHQWNWDSAFAALGFATFDKNRAWQELETLFAAQWHNGMVPHIIFHCDDPDYFPGSKVWQTHTNPPSSGYSQPPVVASIVRFIVERGDNDDRLRARRLLPHLFAYHQWFHTYRDPDQTGVIGIVHPWESGRDNSPDWDSAMDAIIVLPNLEHYKRKDTQHINPAQRPTQHQYDRFLTMIYFGRACFWDQIKIIRNGHFWMADPGVHFILLRANKDLLWLAETLSERTMIPVLQTAIARLEQGAQTLWNDQAGAFCAKNIKTGEFSNSISNASLLAFWAGVGTPEQHRILLRNARAMWQAVSYACPSWHPHHSDFNAVRYWRGPIWAVVNFMIAQGLLDYRVSDLGQHIINDTNDLISKSGFYEYFDPITGNGLGGANFTWTAAIFLALQQRGYF